jgi:mono/diheme cytochrome c family protein
MTRAWPARLRDTFIVMFALCGSIAGCGDDDDPTAADSSSGADTTAGTDAPRFWQDVAPIYFTHCVECHRSGGIAPFALDDAEIAATWAQASAMAVADRTMPPWLVTDDGSCGTFRGSRALSDAQIELITAWADAGAPAGDERDDLVLPDAPALDATTELVTPSFAPVVEGTEYAESDEYRCFLVDASLDADTFLTGYEIEPGNDALVHHVLLFNLDPTLEIAAGETNAMRIAALDDESPDREGWPCFGASGEGTAPSGVPVSWAPGQGITAFPDGVGYRVGADDLLVMQIHYNLAAQVGDAPPVQTTLRLRTADAVEREGFFDLPDPFLESAFGPEPASLAPGQEAVDYTWELEVDPLLQGLPAFDLFGVLPHMHGYGRRLRFDVVHDDGSETCGVEVPRWDFDWQLYYFYEQPVRLEPGDRIRVTCTFDTREATEPVMPGWGTNNEMCLLGVFVVPAQ